MTKQPLVPLLAVSPLDGRYSVKLAKHQLSDHVSEYALYKQRVVVEIEWLISLAANSEVKSLPQFTLPQIKQLRGIYQNFDLADAEAIQALEQQTNHDVKAVEYFVKQQLLTHGLESVTEFVHFACTSEDINNTSYALMLQGLREETLLPTLDKLIAQLSGFAKQHAAEPMLARTHGQAASPTTVGKEIANFVVRLSRQRQQLAAVGIAAKFNGAVGNFNAHCIAYPDINWPQHCQKFIENNLKLNYQAYSTQIEPHDWLAELCHAAIRCNQILLDAARDIWGYISLGYFGQQMKAGEVGSSTMPHKVNPIDFENAEGNLGLANAMLGHMAEKLAISRWQRDLSDSTVLRSVGSAFAYSLLAWDSFARGFAKLKVNQTKLAADLDEHWEVLAEAVQTVMRVHGIEQPYEKLKALTRGQGISQQDLQDFIVSLELPKAVKQQLAALTPAEYIGAAAQLAGQV